MTHRWVLHHRVPDYLRCGWLALPTLEGTHHGLWSVHCIWLCGCHPPYPLTLPHPLDIAVPAAAAPPADGW